MTAIQQINIRQIIKTVQIIIVLQLPLAQINGRPLGTLRIIRLHITSVQSIPRPMELVAITSRILIQGMNIHILRCRMVSKPIKTIIGVLL